MMHKLNYHDLWSTKFEHDGWIIFEIGRMHLHIGYVRSLLWGLTSSDFINKTNSAVWPAHIE